MTSKSKGAAMAQYGIVIALVALGCFAAYSLLGKTIIDQLNSFLGAQNDINTQMAENIATSGTGSTPTAIAGSLGGTPTAPQEDCTSGTCTVDYGDFILSGIPENFQDFVEVQGNAGGTDKLVSIVNQLADQKEADGDLAEAQELRNFANLLAFMSEIESSITDEIKTCPSAGDPEDCFKNNLASANINVPTELTSQGLLTSMSSSSLDSIHQSELLKVGSGVMTYLLNPSYADSSLTSALFSVYDNIQNNPAYSNEMKDVITKTYSTAASLALDTNLQSTVLTSDNGASQGYDIFTGVSLGNLTFPDATFDTIQHPPASDNPILNIP